ncbi:MAG: hypothetical protein DRP57_00725 [Spirochaetes bacterium]|nr:MAG: hypothetical protein DRP57_00725 [Spirochaetota bacterium]
MSDEESLNLEDVGAGADEAEPGQKKGGFLSGALIAILKWVAIGVGIIILVVTTTVVTFGIINKGRKAQNVATVSPEYRAKAPPQEYYDNIESIRGVTSDKVPSIFSLKVSIGYAKGNKEINTELIARSRQIQNIIFLFVSRKKADELTPEHYVQLEEDLKQQINQVMKSGKIESVIFREFVVTR